MTTARYVRRSDQQSAYPCSAITPAVARASSSASNMVAAESPATVAERLMIATCAFGVEAYAIRHLQMQLLRTTGCAEIGARSLSYIHWKVEVLHGWQTLDAVAPMK